MDKRLIFGIVFLLFLIPSAFATINDARIYYSFDDDNISGTTIYDAGAEQKDATSTGATSGATGILEEALDFDGSGDYTTTGSYASPSAITISAWVYLDTMPSSLGNGVVSWGDSTSDYRRALIWDDGSVAFDWSGSTGNWRRRFTATGIITAGSWFHIVWTQNGVNDPVFYVNGTSQAIATFQGGGSSTTTSDTNMYIGKHTDTGWDNEVDGRIDEVAIYNRVLNSSEVLELFNSGKPENPFKTPPSQEYFKIYAQNYTNHSQTYNINTFNASLILANGSFYNFSTTTGNITTNLNNSEIVNLTISSFMSNALINQSFENYNSSTDLYINYSVLNITAKDYISSGSISSFNITFNGVSSQSSGGSFLLYTTPGYYNFIATSGGYNSLNNSYNTTLNASDYIMTLYGQNSVLINIFNATDSVKLSQSATILVEGTNYTQSNTTSDGDIFLEGFDPGSYDILITSSGFQSASYAITIGSNTFQTLNAYLSEDTGTDVTFTFKDQDTGAILVGVNFDVEQFINASYVLVNSLTSDVSGRTQFSYVEGARYRLTTEKTEYEQKQFILDPIIFTAYTIQMEKNLSDENLEQNAEIGINFNPKAYYDDTLHNFSITFSSPTGDFLYYNYTARVTSNGNTISGNGANAFGGTLEGVINVTDATIYDRVIISYRYVKSDGAEYTQSRSFVVSNSEDNVFSFLDNESNPFGLSLFDRVIILVISTLMGSGVAYWFGGFAGASLVGLLIFGYFGAVGLVPMWAVWLSITMGAIVFIWGSGK